MDTGTLILIVVVVVILLAIIWLFISAYNRLFRFRNAAEASMGQI